MAAQLCRESSFNWAKRATSLACSLLTTSQLGPNPLGLRARVSEQVVCLAARRCGQPVRLGVAPADESLSLSPCAADERVGFGPGLGQPDLGISSNHLKDIRGRSRTFPWLTLVATR